MTVEASGWRRRGAATALVTGLTLGVAEALDQRRDLPIVIEHYREEPEGDVVVYFHPDVPEATLVLVR